MEPKEGENCGPAAARLHAVVLRKYVTPTRGWLSRWVGDGGCRGGVMGTGRLPFSLKCAVERARMQAQPVLWKRSNGATGGGRAHGGVRRGDSMALNTASRAAHAVLRLLTATKNRRLGSDIG